MISPVDKPIQAGGSEVAALALGSHEKACLGKSSVKRALL